jgi:hypothetical protein
MGRFRAFGSPVTPVEAEKWQAASGVRRFKSCRRAQICRATSPTRANGDFHDGQDQAFRDDYTDDRV